MNIVKIIQDLLSSGSTSSKIASILGINQSQVGTGISAAVPALLSGVLGSASKPGGAANLANTLAKQDERSTDNLTGLFERGESVSQGNSTLNSLLGGTMVNQIVGAVSRFTGLSEGIIGRLFGLVTPVMLGTLAKHTRGLDASGILGMLKGQKENISAAMPAGLEKALSNSVPGFDKVFDHGERYSERSDYEHQHESERMDRTPVGAGHTGSNWSGIKWLLPLLAICLALYYLPRMFQRPAADRPAIVGESTAGEAARQRAVIDEGTGLLRDTHTQIASIKDEESASAALPKLKDDTTRLSGLRDMLNKLPEPARENAVEHFRPLVKKIKDASAPVLDMPGVGDQVKPTIDALLKENDKLLGSD